MQNLTPVPSAPTDTMSTASAALKRLSELSASLDGELDALPVPSETLLDAIGGSDGARTEDELAALLQHLDAYWDASSAPGETRYEKFLSGMKQALRDEVSLKLHERKLDPADVACLPAPTTRLATPSAATAQHFSLRIQLHDQEQAEVAGALVMSLGEGRSLLVLPGVGATGFATQAELRATLVRWLNTPAERDRLLAGVELRHQDRLARLSEDPDFYLEPFTIADVLLWPIAGEPFTHALDRLLDKQREDVRHVCATAASFDRKRTQARLQEAIGLTDLLGPTAMLELRELVFIERRYRRSLPDWIKQANPTDLSDYAQRLGDYDQARAAMLSVLDTAASPEQFARTRLRARLANDLGYALDPAAITVSTPRTLPLTGETYEVTRSLVELALYGLHPGDRAQDSAFLAHTAITLGDAPAGAEHAELTPAYLARLIEELDLRVAFSEVQRTAYHSEPNQQLMDVLTRRQINALVYAAKMQGHILPGDLEIVEAAADPTRTVSGSRISVHQIKLDSRHVMGQLLVFRKQNASNQLERLVLVAADKPHAQQFKAFDTQTQLNHELIGWTASEQLSQYLLDQVEVNARDSLAQSLAALKLKPYPSDDFIQLIELPDYDAGLRAFTQRHIAVALSRQAHHTPDWYVRASLAQRQALVALEDTASGALRNHQAKPHTYVQPFKDYVHERASQQISKLLDVPAGKVDPDLIVITSERETLTYTDMLLNGYDDGIDFIHTSADMQATFSGPEGVDLRALSPANVTGSVRGKWLADDYIALIKRTLLNPESEGYQYRRSASVMIGQLQMKAAALRSHLKGHIDALQYRWLEASIAHAHLSDAVTRQQYPLYPLQIHVDKPFIGSGLTGVTQLVVPSPLLTHIETVQGCFAVLPTTSRQTALLYTPQAPDGIEFRLFASFIDSLHAPGMIDYYKDRCRIKARSNLSFFLHDMRQGKATKPPFLAEPIADLEDTCFDRPILRKLRDVEETTTGRHDMLAKIIWTSVEIIATVLTLPFPPVSFAVGAMLSLHDSVRALRTLADGDSDGAAAYALASLLNGLGAAGDLHSGLKGFGGLLQRNKRQPGHGAAPLQRQSSLPRYEDLYPVNLEHEPFLLGKPNANGHAPVFRGTPSGSSHLTATGQFATRATNGTWRPLGSSQALAAGPSPSLRSAMAVDISLHNLPRQVEGHAKGVCFVNGNCYIELSGKTYQVHYDAHIGCWQIVDPANPFAFFGKRPVRLDQQGQWQLIERPRLQGGGLDTPSSYRPLPEDEASATVAALRDYELPQPLQPHLSAILSKEPWDPSGMGMEEYFEAYFAGMRQTFATLREKLYRDADAFFVAPTLPPRPTLPRMTPPISAEALIENLFNHSNGLVLSEAPKSVASKRLLILNMPLLVEQRVEILYIEHLFTDKHLQKLNRYYRLGRKTRSGSHEIKGHLEYLNDGALDNQTTEYDYYHLIKAAHRHGIEVRPLSSSISYPFADQPVATAADDVAAVRKMSNFFGHQVIKGDLAVDSSRRWIALIDQTRATTHDQVPGIAQLQGAFSVHVQDVPARHPTRVTTSPGSAAGDSAAHSDFTIEFANPIISTPPSTAQQATSLDRALFSDLQGPQSVDLDDSWAGEYGFQWDNTGGWLRIDPERWAPSRSPTAIQQSLAEAAYEMPAENAPVLHTLANFKHKGLDERYLSADPELSQVRGQLFVLRKQLQRDARDIVSVQRPPRPTLPVVDPQIALPEFLEKLYQHTDGVVIGESHASIASKKLIIDNLPLLSRQNVKTLYLEHLLTDLHQADLDRFFETGEMSKTLLHDLKKLDRGHRTDPAKVYTFERLVVGAQQEGLEIRAIDCAASYHLKGIPDKTPTTRQQMMNYFASRAIRKHQQVMGSHKWIALVGNSHSNTFQNIVPGLAELEGGIGLRVTDVAPGQSRGVVRDPGEFVRPGLTTQTVQIRGDYRIEMDVGRASPAVRPPQPLPVEQRLARPGMFLIEQGEGDVQTVVHRSRDARIHRTPVRVDAEGKLYVERPTWTSIHMTPYEDMDALVDALEEINLTRVG